MNSRKEKKKLNEREKKRKINERTKQWIEKRNED